MTGRRWLVASIAIAAAVIVAVTDITDVAGVTSVTARDQRSAAPAPRKHVLVWADVTNGYQHDSISHAIAARACAENLAIIDEHELTAGAVYSVADIE